MNVQTKLTHYRALCCLVGGILLTAIHLDAASTLYVATEGDHSSGESWTTALTNLQAAIDRIDPGGSIYLKGETFTVTNQVEIIGGSDITMRGGYEGEGSPGAQDRDLWPTTIRLAEGYESRVFYIEGVTNGVIEDIRVSGGNRYGVTKGDAGGGLCLSNNISMTLRGCIITNNLAEKYGGGIAIVGTSASYAGPTLIENCTLIGNRVVCSGSYPQGGGLYAYYAQTITMNDCLVISNTVHGTGPYGGGMALYRNTVKATRTLFADNWLSGGAYFRGGAVQVGSVARLYLVDCIVRNNRCVGGANARGGAIYTDSATAFDIRNTLFHDNIASGTATYGGAICHYTGNKLTLDNCTFAGNSPSAVDRQNVNGPIELNNCILWGNNGQDIIDRGETLKTTAFHCDIQDGFNNGTNNCIRVNPMFMRSDAGDFSLRSASPCREAGMVLGWHAGATDLIGNPRVLPPKGKVDMGALEGLPISASVIVIR